MAVEDHAIARIASRARAAAQPGPSWRSPSFAAAAARRHPQGLSSAGAALVFELGAAAIERVCPV